MEGTATQTPGGDDFDDQSGDTVTVFNHEGDGENTEHLQSMDLHDVKTALEKDAELDEPGSAGKASPTSTAGSSGLQQSTIRPIIQPMLYANGFMVPPFAGTPIYAAAAGIRPIKMEGSDWKVSGSSTVVPYGYPTTAGFLPVDQSTLRYPFIMPGQYAVAATPYQQLTTFGQPAAPNAAVQPNSGLVQPQVKEKKPHIKKPLNAFMIFMKTKRAEVIKECTLKESAAINQILGKMWHALDRTEQAKYYEMAREERARHMQMYPGWSARDNYAIHKKRRKRKAKNESKDEEEVTCELLESGAPEKCSVKFPDSPGQWCGLCKGKKRKRSEDSPLKMSEVTVTKTENTNLLPSVPEIEITTTATNQSDSSIIQSSAVTLQTISS